MNLDCQKVGKINDDRNSSVLKQNIGALNLKKKTIKYYDLPLLSKF